MKTRSSASKSSNGRATRNVNVRELVIRKSIRRDSLRRAKPKGGRPAKSTTLRKPNERTSIARKSATKENTQIRPTKRGKKVETSTRVRKQASPVKVVSDEEDIQLVEKIESLEDNDFGTLLEAFRKDTHNSDLLSVYHFDSTSSLYSTCFERNIKLDLELYYGQSCFACGISEGNLIRCCRDKCFSRYHLECIEPELLSDFHSYIRPKKIECRRHHCATCFAENLRSTAFRAMPDDRAYRCIYCTNAYHLNCLPAGCPQKDYRIICPQHYRRDTFLYPHLPFCFGCRSYFEDNEDVRKDCSRCLRSYHEVCGQVNMRQMGAENVCFYCLGNWSPRKGQLCHVFYEEHFYPAQVAQTNWPEALNIKGIVPLFLIGFGVRNRESLVQLPSCFIVPMIPYEPMEVYYRNHPKCEQFINGYLNKLANLQENPFALLPVRPNAQNPKYRYLEENGITGSMKKEMEEIYDEYDPMDCACTAKANGFKCYSDTCSNRKLGMECKPNCGAGCLNGKESRKVTDSVEIFDASFGGYGLRATKVIPEGHPIGEYTGTIIDKERTKTLLGQYEARRNQEEPLYIMCIDNWFNINSAASGNATRFANHSCNPNTRIVRILGTDSLPHQILYAKRQIEVGEPITFDYNHTWTKYNPRCFCGTESCSGHLSSRLKKKTAQDSKQVEEKEPAERKKTVNRKTKRRDKDRTYNCSRNVLAALADFKSPCI